MLNPRRDVMAGAYRGDPRLDARDKRGHSNGEARFNLIGTRSKARSRQVLGD
jgi:hypothetical protein